MAGNAKAVVRDIGLLILRAGLGLMFVTQHGWDKISHPAEWAKYGAAMGNLGVHFAPQFWGFMAAFSEFAGGICLVLGLLTRPMAGLIAFTMTVAMVMHLHGGDGFAKAQIPLQYGIVALVLLLTGPGRVSLDRLIFRGSRD